MGYTYPEFLLILYVTNYRMFRGGGRQKIKGKTVWCSSGHNKTCLISDELAIFQLLEKRKQLQAPSNILPASFVAGKMFCSSDKEKTPTTNQTISTFVKWQSTKNASYRVAGMKGWKDRSELCIFWETCSGFPSALLGPVSEYWTAQSAL